MGETAALERATAAPADDDSAKRRQIVDGARDVFLAQGFDAASMNDLGILYSEGDGVPRDARTARQWFEKAAALGNPEAKQNLRGMRK